MKKAISLFCAALGLGLALAGCRAFHDHTWSFDYKNHWSDCECGTKIEPAAHNLYENTCIACGAKILSFGDHGYVETYDEHGSVKTSDRYASSGKLIQEDRYEWAYDENGSPTSCRIYSNGVLSVETTYQPSALSGQEVCPKETNYYFEDGSRRVIFYDAYYSAVSDTEYAPDGAVALQRTYDNAYDDLGNRIRQTCYTDGVITFEHFYKLAPDGEVYLARYVKYGEDGSITAERRYDEQGREIE